MVTCSGTTTPLDTPLEIADNRTTDPATSGSLAEGQESHLDNSDERTIRQRSLTAIDQRESLEAPPKLLEAHPKEADDKRTGQDVCPAEAGRRMVVRADSNSLRSSHHCWDEKVTKGPLDGVLEWCNLC